MDVATIPFSSSICLLILFFYFKYVQYFLILIILIGSATAVFQISKICLWNQIKDLKSSSPLIVGNSDQLLNPLSNNKGTINNDSYKCFEGYSEKVANIISVLITSVILVEWLRTGNLILHNILGCSLSILFISTLKFPSLKIALLCLGGLLLYDVFWVFFSEYFFSSNVMVTG